MDAGNRERAQQVILRKLRDLGDLKAHLCLIKINPRMGIHMTLYGQQAGRQRHFIDPEGHLGNYSDF